MNETRYMDGNVIGRVLVIPENWPTIEDFAAWYKGHGCPLRIPEDARIHMTDVTLSIIVFRQGDYQVELYMVHPNIKIPHHSHPMKQIVMWLGGWLQGWMEKVPGMKPWETRHQGNLSPVLCDGEQHAFTTDDKGALLMVLERWRPEMPKSSATIAYDGEELGPIHLATLKALGLR